MILFRNLRWKNLLSTGNIFTEIDLCSNKTTLIIGENGAGKSTILDALSFVLFGKAFRKISKPQLLNSITKKNLVVEIEVRIGKQEYKIIRGMSPNVFEIYQNGSLIDQSSTSKDYQEILEKSILKINHKSFCQVVVLGSASFVPFMQLTTSQRREIIEDLLDLQIFSTMNVLLKQKISDNTNTIWKSEENKKLIDEKIKLVKSHLAELQKNNEILIKEKNERLDKAVKQIEELKIQSDALKTKIESIELTIEDEISISKKINKLGQLRHQIEANLKIINNDVSFFQKHDNCPTCKQIIDNAFKETTVNQKQTQIHEIQNGLHKLIDEHTKTNNRLNEIIEIRSNINSLKIEMGETKTKIVSLMNYKEEIEYEISNIKKKVTSVESTKIEDLEIELAKNQDMLSDLNIQQQLYNTAQQLLKDGGIKTKIVKQFIPIINTLVNKYLSSMDFMVDFRLDENFEETIKSRFRDVFTYSSFSEGEKMKIDLSLLFTWRAVAKLRNSMSTNLLIMDEVFDSSLDSNSVDSLVNLIFQNSPDTNIFIISHKEQMTDKFHNILKFNKNKNFSQITS